MVVVGAVSWQGAALALSKSRGDITRIKELKNNAELYYDELVREGEPVRYNDHIALTMPEYGKNLVLAITPPKNIRVLDVPWRGKDERFEIHKLNKEIAK